MATVQRGSSQPKSEKKVEVRGMSSSEDEAPDEVAFEVSKTAALKSRDEALLAARREKELFKEKRRERQQLFQEQKKKRLLPETLLEEFYNVPEKQEGLSAGTARGEEEDNKNKKVEVNKTNLLGNCSVTCVKDEATDNLLQQSAMDFIQGRLYGPRTQRTTNAVLLSLERKRGAKQGAAIKFVNKKWGAKRKDKAEKSNKRFIHKQKLIPS